MKRLRLDTFKTRQQLQVNGQTYTYFSLKEAAKSPQLSSITKLPVTLKILLENLLRFEDNSTVTQDDITAVAKWLETQSSQHEIAFRPARILMQDFTGVPAIVDLAAMRNAIATIGGDADKINPLIPVDLIIDHSVQVDKFASANAYQENVSIEMQRNLERYQFLHWGQQSLHDFRVVPPGTGICHQVNLEYLGKGVWHRQIEDDNYAFPDTLVGTDSHTTMINGLGVLGWGVGGIEAEAAMLGQPISMLIPEVIGFKLTGKLSEGITATDLVLRVTQMLREKGVVGKFVEFFGPGLDDLPLADRATISNMAPEYGATCGFFPIDKETLRYLELTGRDKQTIALTKAYCMEQGLWRDSNTPEPEFTDIVSLDLSSVEPCLAGPKRPQDRVALTALGSTVDELLSRTKQTAEKDKSFPCVGCDFELQHGDLVIAAITSCTNTSNPSVLMAAGLLAKNAVNKGLKSKPWVKASLAPGSKVVSDYLEKAGLQTYLEQLGFYLVGYGCTTCIGNSGPLPEAIANAITENNITAAAILSGNRNFEGRIHPLVKHNWLASPPLVVAFALAGTTRINLQTEPLGEDDKGKPIYLKDIWPSNSDIAQTIHYVKEDMFHKEYADVFTGDATWQNMQVKQSTTYDWDNTSTYIQHPPFFADLSAEIKPVADINKAYCLALLGDSVTTDHISPAGAIPADSPAGHYLKAFGVEQADFNSYGSRRGNHEVMMRGTFANIRIRNEMLSDVEGGYTLHIPSDQQMPIYDAAMHYQKDQTPLVVVAGSEYGTGSSRDWAAKGTRLLGVKTVIAESYERIHRSNLIGMGVLPLQFNENETRKTLQLQGSETWTIKNIAQIATGSILQAEINYQDGHSKTINLLCRIDTQNELAYYQQGGILHYVLRQLASA